MLLEVWDLHTPPPCTDVTNASMQKHRHQTLSAFRSPRCTHRNSVTAISYMGTLWIMQQVTLLRDFPAECSYGGTRNRAESRSSWQKTMGGRGKWWEHSNDTFSFVSTLLQTSKQSLMMKRCPLVEFLCWGCWVPCREQQPECCGTHTSDGLSPSARCLSSLLTHLSSKAFLLCNDQEILLKQREIWFCSFSLNPHKSLYRIKMKHCTEKKTNDT